MKSNVCRIKGKDDDIKEVLEEVEKAAAYNGLERKQTLQLMLLSEELIGIQKGILGFTEGSFYMENTDKEYRLCLHADVKVDLLTQERFIELSSDNSNAAAKGVLGKIKWTINYLFNNNTTMPPEYSLFDTQINMACHMSTSVYDNVWTLNQYRSGIERGSEEWDELEHSIVANIADDLFVGATSDYVELTAVKRFS